MFIICKKYLKKNFQILQTNILTDDTFMKPTKIIF